MPPQQHLDYCWIDWSLELDKLTQKLTTRVSLDVGMGVRGSGEGLTGVKKELQ